MPNHIHLMWEQLKMNCKEFPKNSFEKFTAKTFINNMKVANDAALKNYAVTDVDRQYNICQKGPISNKNCNQRNGGTKIRLHAIKSNAATLAIV